jgi:PIN domain nuclease of toxin-antitoxin system
MRLLLDTSAFLWFVEGSNRLSETAKNHVEDAGHELSLSIASLWEMAIKISLGKLEISLPLPDFLRKQLSLSGVQLLGITEGHAYAIAALPFHHRDPFDRMLVAQCLIEGLAVVSPDSAFDQYGVERVW